jgi:hypothetical protein
MIMSVAVGMRMSHEIMLYYNITSVHGADPSHSLLCMGLFSRFCPGPPCRSAEPYGFPIAIAMAAARNGNGSDTVARNQTKRAGMNGISHSSSRWKANSAQAIT